MTNKALIYEDDKKIFAHPVLALDYAEYLDPTLGVHIREVAKDILDQAKPRPSAANTPTNVLLYQPVRKKSAKEKMRAHSELGAEIHALMMRMSVEDIAVYLDLKERGFGQQQQH